MPKTARTWKRVRDDFGDLLAAAVTPEQIDKYIERRLASKLSRAPYIRKLSEADNVRQGFFNEGKSGTCSRICRMMDCAILRRGRA